MTMKYQFLALVALTVSSISVPNIVSAASDGDLLYQRQTGFQLNSSRYQSNSLGRTDLPTGFMNNSPIARSSSIFASSNPCQSSVSHNAPLYGGIGSKTYDYGRDRPIYRSAGATASAPCNPEAGKKKIAFGNVPEPASVGLIGLGIVGFFLARRKMKSSV